MANKDEYNTDIVSLMDVHIVTFSTTWQWYHSVFFLIPATVTKFQWEPN